MHRKIRHFTQTKIPYSTEFFNRIGHKQSPVVTFEFGMNDFKISR